MNLRLLAGNAALKGQLEQEALKQIFAQLAQAKGVCA